MQLLFFCTRYLEKLAVVKNVGLDGSAGLRSTSQVCKSANLTEPQFPHLKTWAWNRVAFQMGELLMVFDVCLFQWITNAPRTGIMPSASVVLPAPSQAAWHPALSPAGYPVSADYQTKLTAPVAARRWHFGIFCNRETNHRIEKSGFCFTDQNRIPKNQNNQGAISFVFTFTK